MVQFPIEVEVDAKIEAQMAELMQTPDEVAHRTLFRAAEYYLHNQKDLKQSMAWIDLALEKSPENYRYGLLKAKIYAAQDQREQAIATVKEANAWATAAENQNYMEQTRVYLAGLVTIEVDVSTTTANPYAKDVSSLDNIMQALYASISGEKGEKRDWARFEYLFVPEARLMPSGKKEDGSMGYRIWSVADYVESAGKRLEEVGFHEIEIKREVSEYASLVHVFSTYESYHSKTEEEPFARGINSIQLQNDGTRWWIIHIYWLGESEEWPLPEHHLPEE
jgi:tetratricopeptide (TPR) repeat protein